MRRGEATARTCMGRRRQARRALAIVAVIAGAATAGLAAAQTPPPPESAAGSALQEIVVTATRHEENLSKVPISVTAITQEGMDLRGIKDFQDVARFTPASTSTSRAPTTSRFAASPPRAAPARPASTSTTRRSRYGRSLSIPTMRCRSPSTSTASRCCAARRARCSARAPRAARCATLRRSRA